MDGVEKNYNASNREFLCVDWIISRLDYQCHAVVGPVSLRGIMQLSACAQHAL